MTPKIAALALALALTACGDDAALAPRDDVPSAPSYAANGVVLRVSYEGGFLPRPRPPQLPLWTLFGDGRVFTQGPVPAIYPGPALPNVQVATVSAGTVDRIAREARAAGVDGQQRDYGDPPVADASTTVFHLSDSQGTVETKVYALAESGDAGNEARRKLRELHEHLTDLNGWLGAGTVSAEEAYVPVALAVYATAYRDNDGEPKQPAVAWEGPDPAAGEKTEAGTCTVLTGAELERALAEFRDANQRTRWTHDGTAWAFQLRPLLPDERTCADGLD